MDAVLKDKVLHYLNELKKEKESEAKAVKALIGYTKDKKNEMLLDIQEEVDGLNQVIQELQENDF